MGNVVPSLYIGVDVLDYTETNSLQRVKILTLFIFTQITLDKIYFPVFLVNYVLL